MKQPRMFRCVECGGDVFPKTGAGRVSTYRLGIDLPVPENFVMPTCASCGEIYLTETAGDRLAQVQAPFYEAWLQSHAKKLIDHIRVRHGTTLAHLAGACAVTPTLFSKILSGKKTSLTLVRLLEAFVANPSELQRHLEGGAFMMPQATVEAIVFSKPVSAWSGCASPAVGTAATYTFPTLGAVPPANDIAAA